MESSSCPICELIVPTSELEIHANEHFADEDFARDLEMAQQIAFAPPSPPSFACAEDSLKSVCSSSDDPQSSSSVYDAKDTSFSGIEFANKHKSFARSQNKETFCKVEGGLMSLLENCLELDPENSISIICGHVDHFHSSEWEDVGWGCGWRNIQMLSSHLLSERPETGNYMFGGSGFVPDIASLQKWLELAWEKGFDAPGSDDFDQKIYGKSSWIGTTECAALLRSFGLRARIVDFCSKDFLRFDSLVPPLGSSFGGMDKNADKRRITQVYGPMDLFLSQGRLDLSLTAPYANESRNHSRVSSVKTTNNHFLIEWVWNYFSENKVNKPGNLRVVHSKKTPLYFQHEGHSRTIVGIQAKQQRNGTQQYSLLIFDPSEKTSSLEKSLRANLGWQKLIKRGSHTLKKLQYQLCFVDPGIAHEEELKNLKTLDSIRHNI